MYVYIYIHLGYNMLILHSSLVNYQLVMSLTIILDLLNEPNKNTCISSIDSPVVVGLPVIIMIQH